MPKTVHFSTQAQKRSFTAKKTTQNPGNKKNSKGIIKLIRKKPEWDSSSRDLNAYKLSRQEVELRHKAHQSKNLEVAKHELYDKAKESYDLNDSGNLRPSDLHPAAKLPRAKKLIALQKSLHGHGKQLHDILAESDHAMRIVKDIFGDDPKRYSCQPNVTIAPHLIENKDILQQSILESQKDGPTPTAHASPGGIRDKTVQQLVPRKPALNDLSDTSALDYDGDESILTTTDHTPNSWFAGISTIDGSPSPYKPLLDIRRFQRIVEQESNDKTSLLSGESQEVASYPTNQLSAQSRQHYVASMGDRPKHDEKFAHDDVRQWIKQQHSHDNSTNSDPLPAEGQQHFGCGGKDIDGESLTCVSDLSSIPVDPDMAVGGSIGETRGNATVDSDVSSVYNASQAARGRSTATVSGQHGDMLNQLGVKNIHQGGVLTHPLHMSQKMPSQQMSRQSMESFKEGYMGSTSSNGHADLTRLEKLVRNLDEEVASYDKTRDSSVSGIKPSSSHINDRLSGVVGSVVGVMREMVRYLQQSEAQLKGDVVIRGQFLEALQEQQDLVDILTADLMNVRKENVELAQELVNVRRNCTEKLTKIKEEMASMHIAAASQATPTKPTPTKPTPTKLVDHLPQSPSQCVTCSYSKNESSVGWNCPNLSLDDTLSTSLNHGSVGVKSQHITPSVLAFANDDPAMKEAKKSVSCADQAVIFAKVSPIPYSDKDTSSCTSKAPVIQPLKTDSSSLLDMAQPITQALGPPHAKTSFVESLCAPAPPPLNMALKVPMHNSPLHVTADDQLRVSGVADNWENGDPFPNPGGIEFKPVPSDLTQHLEKNNRDLGKSQDIRLTWNDSVNTTGTNLLSEEKIDRQGLFQTSQATSSIFTNRATASHRDYRPSSGSGIAFDVTGLLDSLKKLDSTQGELQATVNRLRSEQLTKTSCSNTTVMELHSEAISAMRDASNQLTKFSDSAQIGDVSLPLSAEERTPTVERKITAEKIMSFSVATPQQVEAEHTKKDGRTPPLLGSSDPDHANARSYETVRGSFPSLSKDKDIGIHSPMKLNNAKAKTIIHQRVKNTLNEAGKRDENSTWFALSSHLD